MTPFALPAPTFQQALQWGLGRALQQLQRKVTPQTREQVLDACLYCRQFDPQVEGQRHKYLLEAARLAGVLPQLAPRLIEQLETLNENDFDHWDTVQRLGLLTALAKAGDEAAACTIRHVYAQHSQSITELHELIAESFMELDGAEALKWVLCDEAAAFAKCKEVNRTILWQANRILSTPQSNRIIKELRQQNPSIEKYILELTKPRSQKYIPELPKTYSELQEFLPKFKMRISGLAYFRLLKMSEQEWHQLAQEMQAETNPERQMLFISAFAYQPTEYGLDHLFALLEHSNERIVWRVQRVLVHHHHPRIRELALSYLQNPELTAIGIELLGKNAEVGDSILLRQVIRHVAELNDADMLHNAVRELAYVLSHNPSEEFAALSAEAYACQPCAHCRLNMIEILLQTPDFPDWLRAEAMLDAHCEMTEAFELAKMQ